MLLLFVSLLSVLLGGCDVITRLRAVFHPDESPQGVAGSSAITLEIQPSDKIEVFLDGEPVATESPYTARHLKAERHQLHIEAHTWFLSTGRTYVYSQDETEPSRALPAQDLVFVSSAVEFLHSQPWFY